MEEGNRMFYANDSINTDSHPAYSLPTHHAFDLTSQRTQQFIPPFSPQYNTEIYSPHYFSPPPLHPPPSQFTLRSTGSEVTSDEEEDYTIRKWKEKNAQKGKPKKKTAVPVSTSTAPKGSKMRRTWKDEEISFLLDLWSDLQSDIQSTHARKTWRRIHEAVNKKFSTDLTVQQIQKKIHQLVDKYKEAADWNKGQSGGDRRVSPFYDKIASVFCDKDVMKMPHVIETPIETSVGDIVDFNQLIEDDASQQPLVLPQPQQQTQTQLQPRDTLETTPTNTAHNNRQLRNERKKQRRDTIDTNTNMDSFMERMLQQGDEFLKISKSIEEQGKAELAILGNMSNALLGFMKDASNKQSANQTPRKKRKRPPTHLSDSDQS